MISTELWAEIRRLFYAEHWKLGTIAAELGVHHETVREAVESERFNMRAGRPRPTPLDPFIPFIRETLERYPRLVATRVFEMVQGRGYAGTVRPVRRLVAKMRPVRRPEAYLHLCVLPGEQAQVDWGCFGKITIGGSPRPLSCFVMVLSWSRALHALFTVDQTLESFLRGHVEAFAFFGGTPRVCLYDNLKSAVLERRNEAIRFHPRLLELAGHYHFAPRPCAPGRGNEKGRVERAVGYLRHSFFAARSFRSLEDLNAQFCRWREVIAHERPVPGGPIGLTVDTALEQERPRLMPLPAHPFETDLMRAVVARKIPYVRFDRNLYSIPHELVGQPMTLVAGVKTVRLLHGSQEVAYHERSYATGACVENPAHVAALVATKRNARELKGRDRLRACVPETDAFFEALALRGENLGYSTARLLGLLDDYGVEELREAIRQAAARQAFAAGCVAHVIEQRRRARGLTPPVRVTLPADPRVRDLRVIPHRLEDYDELAKRDDPGDRTSR
jgi:transposase